MLLPKPQVLLIVFKQLEVILKGCCQRLGLGGERALGSLTEDISGEHACSASYNIIDRV